MHRFQSIDHDGCRIHFFDLSNVDDSRIALTRISDWEAYLASLGRDNLLVLTDVRNSAVHLDVGRALLQLVQRNRNRVRASAIVGLSADQQALFNFLRKTANREIVSFETRDEALTWLAHQEASDGVE